MCNNGNAETRDIGKIHVVDTHFENESGEAFYPFGTTIYALAYQSDEQIELTIRDEYYGAAEPPVRCGESHLSGLTEPLTLF